MEEMDLKEIKIILDVKPEEEKLFQEFVHEWLTPPKVTRIVQDRKTGDVLTWDSPNSQKRL